MRSDSTKFRSAPPERLVSAGAEEDAVGVFGAAKMVASHLAPGVDGGPQLHQGRAGLHPARELLVFSPRHVALVEEERPAADGANHVQLRR